MSGMNKKYSQSLILFTLGVVVSIANFWHILSQWWLNPPGRHFTWIAHYYADYFLYVSQIAEGVRGSWIWSKSLYTNESMPDIWVYWPNVLMGRLGSIFTDSPFIIYTASLILMVAVLLCLLSFVTRAVFPRLPVTRIVAFLFCISASNFISIPQLIQNGTITLTNQMWFSPTPALNRLGGVPHQTLQTVLLLTVIILVARIMDTKKSHRILVFLFVAVCFLTATVSPIQMLIVALSTLTVMVIKKDDRSRYVAIGIGLLAAAAGAILVNRAFDASPLYAAAKVWEATQIIRTNIVDIMLALGPVIVFIPFGIRRFVREATPLRLIFILYGTLSLILFISPVPTLLGTSPTRWIHPASLMVWYLVAAEGWRISAQQLARRFVTDEAHQKTYTHHISFIFLLLYLVLTIPAIWGQVIARSSQESASALYSDINHVPEGVMRVFAEVKKSNNGTVLIEPALTYDGLVPILTGNKSFTGHPVHTLYPTTKEQLRIRYFTGVMSEAEARRFINDHEISSVIYSRSALRTSPPYPFLTESFHNDIAVLYEVTR